MSLSRASISVVVCALDEVGNIGRCLASLVGQPVSEVIVVDGGSRDGTVAAARAAWPGVTILERPGEGLMRQRAWGIQAARSDLLLILDADDELVPGAVVQTLDFLDANRLDGCQLTMAIDRRTFWARRWSEVLIVSLPAGRSVPMLGRPCLMRRGLFPEDLDVVTLPVVETAREDSYLHQRFLQRDAPPRFAVGPGATVRLQPTTLNEILGKAWRYGQGDASQVGEFGGFGRTLFHLTVRYPIVRGTRALVRFGPISALLCAVVGLTRLAAMTVTLARVPRRRPSTSQEPGG